MAVATPKYDKSAQIYNLQLGHVPLAGWIFYGQDFTSLPASHLLHPAFVVAQPRAQAGFGAGSVGFFMVGSIFAFVA